MGDTMREAFEAFHFHRKCKGAVGRKRMAARLPDGTYVDDSVQRHWWTWQNAVEAGRQLGVDQAGQRATRLMIERDFAQARLERSVKILAAIHGLLYPPPVKSTEGRHLVFRPAEQSANQYMQALSDRIRAIPDELAAAGITTPPADDDATGAPT